MSEIDHMKCIWNNWNIWLQFYDSRFRNLKIQLQPTTSINCKKYCNHLMFADDTDFYWGQRPQSSIIYTWH